MVHVLEEVRRLLAPSGLLVDLRPLLDRWPIEVAWSNGYQEASRATDLPEPRADDDAANAAFQAATEAGGFVREREDTFPMFYYWDTPGEMQEYIAESWDDTIRIDEPASADLRSIWATSNADARVRLRLKLLIARYRLRPGVW